LLADWMARAGKTAKKALEAGVQKK